MANDPHNIPKLSNRFSDLFGVDNDELAPSPDRISEVTYLEESRKLSLNKLLHLAPYSEVLLLVGEFGVGKTSLLNAFIARAAKTWKTAFITASGLMAPEDLLRAMAKDFALDVDENGSNDDLIWALERFIQALGRTGRRAIVVIDDAHVLTDDVLHQTEKLLRASEADSALSLIFCMRQEYEAKLEQFALLREKLAYTLQVQPLNKKELQGYLRLKLANSELDMAQVFPSGVIDEMLSVSGGLPESINELTRALLTKQKSKRPESSRPLNQYIKMILAGIVIFLIAAVLYFQDEINRLFEAPVVATYTETNPLVVEAEIDIEPVVEASPALVLADDKAVPDELILPLELLAKSDESVIEPESKPGPIVAKSEDNPVPKIVEPSPKMQANPEPALKSDPELAWIQNQAEGYFTLQLMALVDHDKVQQFVKNHKISELSATYLKQRKGSELMVLVYGSYSNREEAVTAAKQVPKNWYVGQPWVRSFASVKAELYP